MTRQVACGWLRGFYAKQCYHAHLLDNAVQVDDVIVDGFPRVGKVCDLVHLTHHVVRHLTKAHLGSIGLFISG